MAQNGVRGIKFVKFVTNSVAISNAITSAWKADLATDMKTPLDFPETHVFNFLASGTF